MIINKLTGANDERAGKKSKPENTPLCLIIILLAVVVGTQKNFTNFGKCIKQKSSD